MNDRVTRDCRVPELAMLLRSLPRREYPRCHGAGADELSHGSMDPADVEQMILLAFGQQDILLDVVQDSVERMLGNRHEEVEWRLGASDVHALRDAPIEHRAWQTLLGDKSFGGLAVASLEHRD